MVSLFCPETKSRDIPRFPQPQQSRKHKGSSDSTQAESGGAARPERDPPLPRRTEPAVRTGPGSPALPSVIGLCPWAVLWEGGAVLAGNCDVSSACLIAAAPQKRLSFLADQEQWGETSRHQETARRETLEGWNAGVLRCHHSNGKTEVLRKPGVGAEAASFPEPWPRGCAPWQPRASAGSQGAASSGEREEGNLAHKPYRARELKPTVCTAKTVMLMPRSS